MARPPSKHSQAGEVARFLQKQRAIRQFVDRSPRLMFAVDATASRQPTWDMACHLQSEMFSATAPIAALSVQLCFYRGFRDFQASGWVNSTATLQALMSRVRCEAGQTQLQRVLRHGLDEHARVPVRALIFIGDAIEETPGSLLDLAGQCGLRKLPLFLFQEGADASVRQTLQQMASLSGGAHCSFDQNSAGTLQELLGAVARYAAGGRHALQDDRSRGARLLLSQMKD
ncbi:VWA domain-containing protein [Chromatocurvus halotolerans]|uniref:VWA domain-containing protein n=1 Tax=Chromatocurvus halotolerans TaxID=1132028 RepID=A0A4R2LA62_9GAMM|nr:VWA domain-containing protein [Chromatocurvus halotolerans]TCO76145.1 hypothetical protein EV688_105105 [Chromatocurvus halotolerans]